MRSSAKVELERRAGYLIDKAANFKVKEAPGDAARLAYLMASTGEAAGSAGLAQAAERLTRSLADPKLAIGSSELATSQIAHVILGFHAGGRSGDRNKLASKLLTSRRSDKRLLRASATEDSEKFELSPWVPLALVSVAGDPLSRS